MCGIVFFPLARAVPKLTHALPLVQDPSTTSSTTGDTVAPHCPPLSSSASRECELPLSPPCWEGGPLVEGARVLPSASPLPCSCHSQACHTGRSERCAGAGPRQPWAVSHPWATVASARPGRAKVAVHVGQESFGP
jgi:hypothetical protein